jgi:hypothetical protein
MPTISFLRPVDQPTGRLRLLDEFRRCLQSKDYSEFKIIVGFAKAGPLIRLWSALRQWKEDRNKIEGIFGVDQRGTSRQALALALSLFDKVYVTQVASSSWSTFHPKLYIFQGDRVAACYYGSHNLTVGGTETNFEGGVKIGFDRTLPSDEAPFQQLLDCWNSLLPANCSATEVLDQNRLNDYVRDGLLLDEESAARKRTSGIRILTRRSRSTSSQFWVKPPSSIPKEALVGLSSKSTKVRMRQGKKKPSPPGVLAVVPSRCLVIQIVPHHNGEIFLSKNAIDQNPTFFQFPFTGLTVPKKPTNKAYPQRIPDPTVSIVVIDKHGKPIGELERVSFRLNMVYYETKSEIRITVNPELARRIPSHSVLVMSKPQEHERGDYEMEIYLPGSKEFNSYLGVCDQTLPSGGAARPRRMGWL